MHPREWNDQRWVRVTPKWAEPRDENERAEYEEDHRNRIVHELWAPEGRQWPVWSLAVWRTVSFDGCGLVPSTSVRTNFDSRFESTCLVGYGLPPSLASRLGELLRDAAVEERKRIGPAKRQKKTKERET